VLLAQDYSGKFLEAILKIVGPFDCNSERFKKNNDRNMINSYDASQTESRSGILAEIKKVLNRKTNTL
jgi:hypothetical protein